MRSDKNQLLWKGEEHPPLDVLRDYQEEALPAPASHEVERHLIDCELCTDLLQGMTLSDRSATRQAVGDLSAQLRHLGSRKRKRRLPLIPLLDWRAAATILVLLCSIGLVVYFVYDQLQRERLAAARKAEIAAQAELFAIRSSTDTLLISVPGYNESAAPATKPSPPAVAYQKPAGTRRGSITGPENAESDRTFSSDMPAAEMVAGTATRNRANSAMTDVEKRAPDITAKELSKSKQTVMPATAPTGQQREQVQSEQQAASVAARQSSARAQQIRIAGVAVQDRTAVELPDTTKHGSDMFAKATAPPVLRSTSESIIMAPSGYRQQFQGQVLSEQGEALPGVAVVVKGTATGTSTDSEGNFIIQAPAGEATLAISYIGYVAKEVAVDATTSKLKVKLTPDASALNEVVVVGYEAVRASEAPVPEGGMKAYKKYIEQDRRYPAAALPDKVTGRVVAAFTVTAEGRLENIRILKSLHPALDAEVLRLVKEGPTWKPARNRGRAVPQEVKVSIRFKPPQ